MATGIDRLKDKHKEKGKEKNARLDKILASSENDAPEKPKRAKITRFKAKKTIVNGLNEIEKQYYEAILSEVEKVHPANSEKYTLAIVSLAKLYHQQDALESIITQDGGLVQRDQNYKLYSHPAATMLQRVQSSIIRNLTSLGLTLGKKQVKEESEDNNTVSEFASFQ